MANPEAAARELLRRHDLNELPIDVEALARAEGALVVRSRFDGNVSGMVFREDGRTVLGVNASTSPRRQRFTVAHELGHIVLHAGRPLTVDSQVRVNFRDDVSSRATDDEEIQANAFAAALLMPAGLVRQEFLSAQESGGLTREQVTSLLARRFDVSAEAMGYRLINLALLAG